MKKAALLLILFCSMAAAEEGWHIETIDTGYLVGLRNTIDITSTGEPRMLYSNYHGGRYFYKIIYVYWDGFEWKKDVVDIGTCHNCSLSIDTLDRPHITYIDNSNKLVYAYHDGSEWQIHQFGWGAPFGYLEIEMDSNNQPHIGYRAAWVMYLHWDGEEWQRETVDSSDIEGGCSMELDSSDYPRFSYMVRKDYHNNNVTYTWWDGLEWNSETIGEVYLLSPISDIDIDKEDKPHIMYYDSLGDNIYYAHLIDGEWQTDFLDSGYNTRHFSVETDAQNYPHIAYFDSGHIKYAYWDGIEWQYIQIDQHGHEMDWCSLVLDSEDNPHISYNDADNDLFKYAWYGEELGVGVGNLFARADDEGILLSWLYDGPTSASLKLLRSAGAESWIGAASYPLPTDANMYLDREVMPGVEYRYWLEVTEDDGTLHRFGPTEPVTIPTGTGNVTLAEPYPCPATGRVTIEYALPEATQVELVVYDLAGRRVATLVDGEQTAGRHAAGWNIQNISPGVYLYRLTTERVTLTRRLIVTR